MFDPCVFFSLLKGFSVVVGLYGLLERFCFLLLGIPCLLLVAHMLGIRGFKLLLLCIVSLSFVV
jgi:hypothetical protein